MFVNFPKTNCVLDKVLYHYNMVQIKEQIKVVLISEIQDTCDLRDDTNLIAQVIVK